MKVRKYLAVTAAALLAIAVVPHAWAWANGALKTRKRYISELSAAYTEWAMMHPRPDRGIPILTIPEPIHCDDREILKGDLHDLPDDDIQLLLIMIERSEYAGRLEMLEIALADHYSPGGLALLAHCIDYSPFADFCGRRVQKMVEPAIHRLERSNTRALAADSQLSETILRNYACAFAPKDRELKPS